MGGALFAEFVRTLDDPITKGRWFSLNAVFGPPKNVGFNVHGFGDDRGYLSDEDHRQWKLAGGIDGFLEYECEGYISHPSAFAAKTVSFLINPLGSLDRFKLREKGSVGHGWYDGANFLIRIYIDFALSQQLLSFVRQSEFQRQSDPDLLGQIRRDATGYDPSGLNVRFDLFDLKYQEKTGWTSYEICRIYI